MDTAALDVVATLHPEIHEDVAVSVQTLDVNSVCNQLSNSGDSLVDTTDDVDAFLNSLL